MLAVAVASAAYLILYLGETDPDATRFQSILEKIAALKS